MTEQNFIKECTERGINANLAQAVIDQFGDWEAFTDYALDVYNNGINGGYSGFVYYVDTCEFFQNNRDDIMAYAEDMATDLGEDVFGMFKMFGCMKSLKPSASELAKAIYKDEGDLVDQIQNCLAWFAGEEVCKVYGDLFEQGEIEDEEE